MREERVPEQCLDEYRKWKDCICSFSKSETCEWDALYQKVFIKLLLYYCLLVTLLLAQNFGYPVFLMSTKEGMSFSKSWKTATGDFGHVSCSLRDEKKSMWKHISHPGVAFGLLVSWMNLTAAQLKHWLWNVWAASFSGITAQSLVGLFVLLMDSQDFHQNLWTIMLMQFPLFLLWGWFGRGTGHETWV